MAWQRYKAGYEAAFVGLAPAPGGGSGYYSYEQTAPGGGYQNYQQNTGNIKPPFSEQGQ